jgi:class 3 adenylate cyclase
LREGDLPVYVEHFMGEVADLISASFHKPLSRNVWGDAFFLTFSSVKDAGNYAINLSERISNINWERKGLPKDINLRISLHSGPAYYFKDPVLRKNNYIGEHINRVARIEVITPPGQIYASQEFAALSAAQRVKDYECCYVGQIPLPKDAGTFPLYHVSPKKH